MPKRQLIPTKINEDSSGEKIEIHPVMRPSTLRVFVIMYQALKLFVLLMWAKIRRDSDPDISAKQTRKFLESLGGIWLKVGQVLAMRTDIFSVAFCNELGRLQDSAYGFPGEVAAKLVSKHLGDLPLAEVFSEFDLDPVAAASFAQVHRARLRHGGREVVAVKIQKPYAEALFKYDLFWIALWFGTLDVLHIGAQFRWGEMVEEIRTIMIEELDYRTESASIRDMRKVLKAHRIYVPKVFTQYTKKRLLVMEFIEGVTMSQYIRTRNLDETRAEAWLVENKIDPKKIAETLLTSLFRQMFEDNLVHGDLHPGNIVLLRKSHIAFLDFGTVSSHDVEFIALYKQYLFAIASKKFAEAADIMLVLMGPLPPMDIQAAKKKMVAAMQVWVKRATMTGVAFNERSLSSSSNAVGQVALEYRLPSNWGMLKLGRAFNSLDMSIGGIYPDVEYPKLLRKYYKGAAKRDRLRLLGSIVTLPQRVSGLAVLVTSKLRGFLLRYESARSEVSEVLLSSVRAVRIAIVVFAAYMVFVYLHQQEVPMIGAIIAKAPWLTSLVARIPPWTKTTWAIFFGVLIVVGWRINALLHRVETRVFRDI